jgi:hypothetical protein
MRGEERVAVAAAALGLEVEVRAFPRGTRTAADAAAAVGCDVAQIVKSLVFVIDDEPVVALVGGGDRSPCCPTTSCGRPREHRPMCSQANPPPLRPPLAPRSRRSGCAARST